MRTRTCTHIPKYTCTNYTHARTHAMIHGCACMHPGRQPVLRGPPPSLVPLRRCSSSPTVVCHTVTNKMTSLAFPSVSGFTLHPYSLPSALTLTVTLALPASSLSPAPHPRPPGTLTLTLTATLTGVPVVLGVWLPWLVPAVLRARAGTPSVGKHMLLSAAFAVGALRRVMGWI